MRLTFDWGPDRQRIAADDVVFEHEGPAGTRAEHDVAHLMLAANGRLPWCPQGSRSEVCLAEFNAVHLEVLLVTAAAGVSLEQHLRAALPGVIPHMRWFTDVHYAPFPIPMEEALARFWAELLPFRVAPMLPLFRRMRTADQTKRLSATWWA